MDIQNKEFRILLVEDSEEDAVITTWAFKKNFLIDDIIHFKTAEGAHHYLSNAEKLPSIILTDLNLTGMSGQDLIRLIKSNEKTKDIPIVVLTGSKYHRHASEANILDVSACIVKPLDVAKLKHIASIS